MSHSEIDNKNDTFGENMILNLVIEDLKRSLKMGQTAHAVFDLDSTLFCVSPRTQIILRELARDLELSEQFPEETRALARIEVHPTDWGLRSVLIRHKIRSTLDFFEILRVKWMTAFFSNDYLKYDVPYDGAVEFTQHLQKMGVSVQYLTGRDIPRMGEGTKKSLAHWKFPLIDPNHLHMKPEAQRHDAEFKLDRLITLQGPDQNIWFFENEPVIINLIQSAIPKQKIVFMDSVHSGRESVEDSLPRLSRSFDFG